VRLKLGIVPFAKENHSHLVDLATPQPSLQRGVAMMSSLRHLSTLSSTSFDIFDNPANKPDTSAAISIIYEPVSVPGVWRVPCDCSMTKAMFRISTIDTHRERRLVVEGTLIHPWVDELRKTWSDAGNSLDDRNVVIDLTNVIVISREGENAIFELMKEGAKFSCGGVLTRHLLKQLAHRCHTKLNDVLNRKR
jgi:hypothetical protein